MPRKATADQLARLGRYVLNGVEGREPSREELQVIFADGAITGKLGEAGGTILNPVLSRLRSTASAQPIPSCSDLLELVTTVDLPAIEAFTAQDDFKEHGAPGGISFWFGDNFTQRFLRRGKIEIDVPARTLRVHRLRKDSIDEPIIRELGGEQMVETHLAHVFHLISQQANGQPGVLLTNGWANIFYVRDADENFWAVRCRWDSDDRCWDVGARSVTLPYPWDGGCQVFSR